MSKLEHDTYFEDKLGERLKAKINFETEEEIERIRKSLKYKMNARNALGVKTSEDWIYSLYIGNVMHLSPLR
jgi:hypothetical protein